MTLNPDTRPVAVIGAGPIGLAAAAHLAARNLPFVVFEAGSSIAASVRDWAHVQLFSPWLHNIDPTARTLLESTGWSAPDDEHLPTGREIIDHYLAPLAGHPAIAPQVQRGASVIGVARSGLGKLASAGRDEAPFRVQLADGREFEARAVIDASGTWRTPNPLGVTGLPARGEAEARADGRILDGMPDVLGQERDRFAGRRIAVAGAGHSATGTLIALAELAQQEPTTTIAWLVRAASTSRALGGGDADALPARGALGVRVRELAQAGLVEVHTGFRVGEITDRALLSTDGTKIEADLIVNATGARPDFSFASELRLDLDPVLGSTRALAPLIDPNVHSCGTVPPHGVDELAHPEAGYFAIGAKSYGRASTFLLATGYEQARSVVAALDGDWDAARNVALTLPETGVCRASLPVVAGASTCS